MSIETGHSYLLVVIQSGKEQEFADEVVSKGLILDSEVEKLDFVHGSFDFIVVLSGNTHDIDRRILEIRKIPYVQSTETLIPFEMLNWDEISAVLKEPFVLPKNDTHCIPSLELELAKKCVSPIVLYSTKAGKTKKIAVEFASEMNCPCIEINKNSDSSTVNLSEFDLVLIGTGIYQTFPNADMVSFLKSANLDGDKQFALFLTWYKIGQNDKVVFHKIDEILKVKGKKLLDDYFECLGDFSKGRPNDDDLNAARKWVSSVTKNV